MKVYTKKGDYKSTIPVYIVMFIFFIVPVGLLIYLFSKELPLVEKISYLLMPGAFGLVFLGIDIMFMYYLIKKPVPYKAKLVKKEKQKYNNQDIIYMGFEVIHEEPETDSENDEEIEEDLEAEDEEVKDLLYYCYTTEDNHYQINEEYDLYLKEFNWMPKYIEEPKGEGNIIKELTMLPLLIILGFIFTAIIISCIIGLIKYQQFKIFYSLAIIVFSIGLYMLYNVYKNNK